MTPSPESIFHVHEAPTTNKRPSIQDVFDPDSELEVIIDLDDEDVFEPE